MHIILIFMEIIFLFLLRLDFFLYFRQRLLQSAPCNRFEQVLLHPFSDGLPCVFKIIIPADDDDLHLRKFLSDNMTERQAVHKGHLDIRDQHIRPGLSN